MVVKHCRYCSNLSYPNQNKIIKLWALVTSGDVIKRRQIEGGTWDKPWGFGVVVPTPTPTPTPTLTLSPGLIQSMENDTLLTTQSSFYNSCSLRNTLSKHNVMTHDFHHFMPSGLQVSVRSPPSCTQEQKRLYSVLLESGPQVSEQLILIAEGSRSALTCVTGSAASARLHGCTAAG